VSKQEASGSMTRLCARLTGVVVKHLSERGFGFIRPDDAAPGSDVFLHISAIEPGDRLVVNEGSRVEFSVAPSDGRRRRGRAYAVKLLD
jgi:cold shock CspA family protein